MGLQEVLKTPTQPPGHAPPGETPLASRLPQDRSAATDKLERITTETDNFIRKIERQKRRVSDLDTKIARLTSEVERKRKEMSKARQLRVAQRRGQVVKGSSNNGARASIVVGLGHIRPGDRLEARLKGWKKFHAGEVEHVNADGSFAVTFADGEHADSVQPNEVRPIGGKAGMGSSRATCSQQSWDVKLNVARVQLNNVLGDNRDTRQRINELRRDRNLGLAQHDKMVEQRSMLFGRTAELRDGIRSANDGAAEANAMTEAVECHAQEEVEALKKQWQEQGQVLDAGSEGYREQIKLREEKQQHEEDMKKEGTSRALDILKGSGGVVGIFGLGKNRKGSLLGGAAGDVLAGSLSIEEETQLKHKIQRGHWQVARGRLQVKNLENKVQNYEEGFNLIKQKTGINDINEMVTKFCAREEENFGLFNYVNELSSQIESIEEAIDREQAELEKFRGKEDDAATGASILKSLEDKLGTTERTLESERRRIDTNQRLLEGLKGGIASTFHRIGCKAVLVETLLRSRRRPATERKRRRKKRADSQVAQPSPSGVGDATQTLSAVASDKVTQVRGNSGSAKSELLEAGESSSADAGTHSPPRGSESAVSAATSINPAASDNGESDSGGTDQNVAGMNGDDDEAVDDDVEITFGNMMQYLGVIEQRVTELVLAYASQLNRRGEEVPFLRLEARRGANESVDGRSGQQHVPHLPSANKADEWMSDDDEEEMLRPMRHEELMERVSSSLAMDRQQQQQLESDFEARAPPDAE